MAPKPAPPRDNTSDIRDRVVMQKAGERAYSKRAARLREQYMNDPPSGGTWVDRVNDYGAARVLRTIVQATTGIDPGYAAWAFQHPIDNMLSRGRAYVPPGTIIGGSVPVVPGKFMGSAAFLKGGRMRMGSKFTENLKRGGTTDQYVAKSRAGGPLDYPALNYEGKPVPLSRKKSADKRTLVKSQQQRGRDAMEQRAAEQRLAAMENLGLSDIAALPEVDPFHLLQQNIRNLPELDPLTAQIRRATTEYSMRRHSPSKIRERAFQDQAGAAVENERALNDAIVGMTQRHGGSPMHDDALNIAGNAIEQGTSLQTLVGAQPSPFDFQLPDAFQAARNEIASRFFDRGTMVQAATSRFSPGATQLVFDARRMLLNQPGARMARRYGVMDTSKAQQLAWMEQWLREQMQRQRGGTP